MHRYLAIGLVLAASLFVVAGGAEAQFKGEGKYLVNLIENNTAGTNPTCGGAPPGTDCTVAGFSWPAGKEKSKVLIKPSKTDGDGGVTIKLIMSNLDCPGEPGGNDQSLVGKCGPKTAPIEDHVLLLNSTAIGLTTRVGLLYNLKQGKGLFQANGKNKVGGADLVGPLVTIVFTEPLFINSVELKEPGTDVSHPTTGCDVIPLPMVDTCSNGLTYARTGVRVGEDLALSCANTAECDDGGANPTLICFLGGCTTEPCTNDVDCDQNGGGSGGTGECGSDGGCCDPAQEPGCAAEVP
jgi:hypothetical protein